MRSSFSSKARLIRNMLDCRPFINSPMGGKFLKAVIAKFSERVKATKGIPCLAAGMKLLPELAKWMTTPSSSVRPCDLFTEIA